LSISANRLRLPAFKAKFKVAKPPTQIAELKDGNGSGIENG